MTGSGASSAASSPFNTRDAMLDWMQEIAPFGIFTTDADLIIRSWNHWLVMHSGLAAATIIGRPLFEVFPDLIERKFAEPFRRALQGEVGVFSTALHRYLLPLPATSREYGVPHMLQTARIAPLPSGERIVGTLTIIEDVTQRECQAVILRRQQEYDRLLSDVLARLLQSETPLETAGELFPRLAVPLKLDVYINHLLSPEGELRLHVAGGMTPEASKSLGVLQVGETLCGLIAARHAPVVEHCIQDNPGEDVREMRRLGLRSFAGFPLQIGDRLLGTLAFGSYEHDGIADESAEVLAKVAQYLAISLDRAQRGTELHLAQQRLGHHAVELELKIAERTAALQQTIAQLERFSYTIAHDLRAPIRSLTGYSEILLGEYRAHLPEEARGVLQRLNQASHRLDALTRDLLKFSRVAQQDVTLSAIDPRLVVDEIVASTPQLQGGVLAVQGPFRPVRAHRTLLQQCFANLFDNALKFIPPGVSPSIVVRFEPDSSRACCRIWIEDNGIGVPPHAHQRIFGIFERIPGAFPVEGTGIGLAIVARAMEQMEGKCGVESAPGAGSRFWLEFSCPPA